MTLKTILLSGLLACGISCMGQVDTLYLADNAGKTVQKLEVADIASLTFPASGGMIVEPKNGAEAITLSAAQFGALWFIEPEGSGITDITVQIDDNADYSVYDLNGRALATKGDLKITMQNLAPGAYVIKSGRQAFKIIKK